MAIMAPVAGKLADRFASRVVATIGCSIVAVGLFLLNIPLIMAEPWWIGLALLILGIGFGLFSTPNNNSIVSSVTKAEIGVASAAMNLGRTVGNLIGMSVVNTMIHIIIGDVPIESASLDDIANTVELALMLSLGMVLCACIASGARGR
jgi:MFS family permease